MTIDLDILAALHPGVHFQRIRSVVFPDLGNVEVAWLRFHRTRRTDDGQLMTTNGEGLYTDESCWTEMIDGERAHVIANDTPVHHQSRAATERALAIWAQEVRTANATRWAPMDPVAQVRDVVTRVWAGEWLGQRSLGVIDGREIARLLDFPNPESFGSENPVWAHLGALEAAEVLSLDGAFPQPYVARFRFPHELRSLLRYVVEEPLGWPNGEAGDVALAAIERAIHDHSHYHHGKDLVWPENFPHLAPHHLVGFGLAWLAMGVHRTLGHPTTQVVAEAAEGEQQRVCRQLIPRLEALLGELRAAHRG